MQKYGLYHQQRQRGLTLIEVAFAMAILGLLMAAALAGYRIYQQTRAQDVTVRHLDAVEEALGTYVARFQRYPAPMAFRLAEGEAGFGRAATMAGACSSRPPTDARACRAAGTSGDVLIGSVPFQDLNLPAEMMLDGYGRRFTYAVSEAMTHANGNNATLRDICMKRQVLDEGGAALVDACNTVTNPLQDVAIISHGRDGIGAWTPQGKPYLECDSVTARAQYENCNNDGTFLLPTARFLGDTADFNDDVVSADILGDSNYWNKLDEGILNREEQYVGVGVETPGRALDVGGNIKADKVRTLQLCKRDGDNQIDCFDPALIAGDQGMRCGVGGYVKGIAFGNVICEPIIAPFSCPPGQILTGITADGAPQCKDPSVSTCVASFQDQSVPCPAGETGTITQRRDMTCPTEAWGSWYEVSRTCQAQEKVCKTYTVVVSNSLNPSWGPQDVGATCPSDTYAEDERVLAMACIGRPAKCAANGHPGWQDAVEQTKAYNCRPLNGQVYASASDCADGTGSIDDSSTRGCIDECGNIKPEGAKWCPAGSYGITPTFKCINGEVVDQGGISGLGCDRGGNRMCP